MAHKGSKFEILAAPSHRRTLNSTFLLLAALCALLWLIVQASATSGPLLVEDKNLILAEQGTLGSDVNRTVRIRAYKDATLIRDSYAGCNGSCAESNFGLSPVLQLGSYHLVADVVMGFILTPPVPTQSRIHSCRLVLPTKAITVVGNSHVLVSRISLGNAWSEEDVTWAARPLFESTPLGWVNMVNANLTDGDGTSNDNNTEPGTLEIDPEICEQNLQADSEIGFNLHPEPGVFISFSSKEDTSSSAQHAYLEVSYWCCPDQANARSHSGVAPMSAPDGASIIGFLIVAALVTSVLSLPFHFPFVLV